MRSELWSDRSSVEQKYRELESRTTDECYARQPLGFDVPKQGDLPNDITETA